VVIVYKYNYPRDMQEPGVILTNSEST